MCHRRLIQRQNHSLELAVSHLIAEIVDTAPEGILHLLILLLQELLQHILLNQLRLSLIHLPKARIQVNLREMIPDQPRTEAVDRCDLRTRQQCLLPLQVHIAGVL